MHSYSSNTSAKLKPKSNRSSGLDMTIDSVLSVTAFGKSASKAPDEDGILMMEITPGIENDCHGLAMEVSRGQSDRTTRFGVQDRC